MPTYEYVCDNEHRTERFQKEYVPRIVCPVCGRPADKVPSTGTSFVLKGDGWASDGYNKKGDK